MTHTEGDLLQKYHTLQGQYQELKARLQEAEDALRAISTGEVDALVVYGDEGERIYTLQGADYAYRVMVESIHEGAANVDAEGTILYCNKRLAEMLDLPLEKVLGTSFYNYLPPVEKEIFQSLIQTGLESFDRAEMNITSQHSAAMPVLVTAGAAEVDGRQGVCLVITDLTEQKQALARERELQIHLMEQREEERVRIARNLHDGPLQDIIALSYTTHTMMTSAAGPKEADDLAALRESLLTLASELRGVCNDLRPPTTMRFGLAKAIQYQSDEIKAKFPNLKIELDLVKASHSLPNNVSNALFRIFQESLNNIIRHAHATTAKIKLRTDTDKVQLEIYDNGAGFQLPTDWVDLARSGHLGLVGMRERAEALGGHILVRTGEGSGTTIQVDVPCELRKPG